MEWYPFSDRQLDFIVNSKSRLCIADGAVRAGKTIACNIRFLTFMANGPKGDLALFSRTRDTLQRNVLNTLFDIVGDKNYHWLNKQSGELIILGRKVYCFGANTEEAETKIRGATFAGALCDEANLYPQNVFRQILARLSVNGAQCFINCNPDSPAHWLYKEYITNPNVPNKQRWRFKMEDNLSLSPSYIADLKAEYSVSKVWYDRMINGEWVSASGRIYDMFDPAIHTKAKVQSLITCNPNAITWLVACDYATSSVMSWGLYALCPDGTVYKTKEFYYDAVKEKSQKTDAQFGGMFQIWLDRLDPWMVYCDPSASSWKAELRSRGYRVTNGENDVINGIRQVGKMLGTGKYLIDSSCVNTIDEYMTYVWDETAQAVGIDKPVKMHDHAVDTDKYCLTSPLVVGGAGSFSIK